MSKLHAPVFLLPISSPNYFQAACQREEALLQVV